jgi:hypothetical protein
MSDDQNPGTPVSASSSASSSSGPAGAVRTHSWSSDGPAELDLDIEVGRLDLRLTEDATAVEVEVRAQPPGPGTWQQGASGLLSWISEVTGQDVTRVTQTITTAFGGGSATSTRTTTGGGRLADLFGGWDPARSGAELAADAVQATEVSWSEDGRRLLVRSPAELPLRLVPLVVTVRAPAGSRLAVRSGSGDITVTGRAGGSSARTGAGDIRLDAVDGDAELNAGSGTVQAGPISGRTRARTGSGDLSLAALNGPGDVKAGSGKIRLGEVRADLLARTGSGSLQISDAESGRLDLTTGSGDLRVGVHAGVIAELDVSSRSGRVRSELDVRDGAPDTLPATGAVLVVHGRAGSGDVLVSRA